MRNIRVLVVDDSVVIRRLLTDILSQDPEIEVVGTAPNGRIALCKLPQLNPDVVTLDIEMPELDGLATLPPLRKDYPKLPVIMFSTLTERGASSTLEALARGASDYVAKPTDAGSMEEAMQSVKKQIIQKIKALCPYSQRAEAAAPQHAPRVSAPAASTDILTKRRDLVVIAASTGGPKALGVVLQKLPADFPVPIVVVQHMPPVFTKNLAEFLDQTCAVKVAEASGGETLRPGQVLIAPGNFHIELASIGAMVTNTVHQQPPENSCRPAADVLFRSAASVLGSRCLAVVLTGMGQDGMRGGQHIVEAGGVLIAQDEESSVVWGMPRAVTEAGLAARTLPLESIADQVIQIASAGRAVLS